LKGGARLNDMVIVVTTMVVCVSILLWLKITLKDEEAQTWVKQKSYLHPDVFSCMGLFLAFSSMGLFHFGFGIVAAILYVISSMFDGVDGTMARAWGRGDIDYGKFIDAFFDKLRYGPPLIFFAVIGCLPSNFVMAFLVVDFVVGQFVVRIVILYLERAFDFELTIGSNYFGKVKTVLADFLNVYCLLLLRGAALPDFTEKLLYLVFALAILSIIFKFFSFKKMVMDPIATPVASLVTGIVIMLVELKRVLIKSFFGKPAAK